MFLFGEYIMFHFQDIWIFFVFNDFYFWFIESTNFKIFDVIIDITAR